MPGRPSGRLAEGGPLGRQCRRRDVHHLGKQLRRSGSLCRARRVQAGQGELTAEPVELTAEPVELTAEPMYLTAEPMEDPGIDCIPFAFDCLNAPLAEAVFDPSKAFFLRGEVRTAVCLPHCGVPLSGAPLARAAVPWIERRDREARWRAAARQRVRGCSSLKKIAPRPARQTPAASVCGAAARPGMTVP